MADDDARWRVKVYILNSELQWEEKGVGYATCQHSARHKRMCIHVEEEGSDELLLEAPILPISADEEVYKKQQDTLLVWEEPDGKDLALSFQEKEGCDDMLERIQLAQAEIKVAVSDDETDDYFDDDVVARLSARPTIPDIEMGNLAALADVFGSTPPTKFMRDRVAKDVIAREAIPKLLELFRQCEDLEDAQGLGHIFTVFKGMFTLGESVVTDALCKPDTLLDVIGVLEYNPSLAERIPHRQFITEKAVFREVIPLKDADVLALIHHTFQLQYLRDVILPCILDDPTTNTLASHIMLNHVSIVTALRADAEFVDELFARLKDPGSDSGAQTQLLGFLTEFLTLGKELPAEARAQMLKDLIGQGLLDTFLRPLGSPVLAVRQGAAVALSLVIQQDVAGVRKHILAALKHGGDGTLLHTLAEGFARETELGMVTHLTELIRPIMDTETMDAVTEKSGMLRAFYEECAETLLRPLTNLPAANDKAAMAAYVTTHGAQLYALLELLSTFIGRHGPMLKTYWLRSSAITKIAQLIGCGKTYLVLGALRLVRSMVALKDDAYLKQLIKSGLYGAVMHALVANGPKYNMLNSAVIDLFDYIRKENLKATIKHVVEVHGELLREIDYVTTFKEFCLRYEQNEDSSMLEPLPDMDSEDVLHRGRQERVSSEEENWFDDDDDDKKDLVGPQQPAPAADTNDDGPVLLRLPIRRRSDDDDEEDSAAMIGLLKSRKEPRTRHNSGSDSSDSESSAEGTAKGKVRGLTSLVDYGDNDSDEDLDHVPDSKRSRIETSN